jgi:menaquinone-dependent protoporphyrinogen IX oxidase
MATAIVYRTILGNTEQYAKWLAEEIDADLYLINKIEKKDLKEYDIVVVSSGIYIGWMPLVNFLKNNWDVLCKKKVVVVAVGLSSKDNPSGIKSLLKIPEAIREKIKYYKLPGRIASLNADFVKRENVRPVTDYILTNLQG